MFHWPLRPLPQRLKGLPAAQAGARPGRAARVNLQLAVRPVQTDVQANSNQSGVDSDRRAGTSVLGTKDIQQLADDPLLHHERLVHLHSWYSGVVHVVVSLAVIIDRPDFIWVCLIRVDVDHPSK